MATISLEVDDPAALALHLECAARSNVSTFTSEVLATAAYQIQEQIDPPTLNSPPVGQFQVTIEDLESLAGGVVPEWLKYDADAAIGAVTEPAHLLATPTPTENKLFEEGFDAACDELTGTLTRLLDAAITGERKDAYEKAIAAVAHQKAWA